MISLLKPQLGIRIASNTIIYNELYTDSPQDR